MFSWFFIAKEGKVTDITSDDFEAWVGMFYLSYEFSWVKEVVLMLMSEEIDRFDPERNYIGILQEYFQKHGDPPLSTN